MYEGKPYQLFFRYAVPQMIGLLFNSVYTIVDGVFIGNRLGREAMAAAAVAVPLIEILISLSLAVASGADVLFATHLQLQEKEKARTIFNTAVWALAAAGLLIAAAGSLFLRPLAQLLGATPDILEQSAAYLWYIVTFAPFQLFSFLLGGMARNDGRPRLAMAAMILGAASNIVLDYVFMYPLNMGIGGAALATALGPIFSVLVLLPHFLRRRGALYFQPCRPAFRAVRMILLRGFPSFIMEFSIGMVTFFYNFAITRYGYGEIGLASYLLIGYLMLIVLTLFLGMAEGLQPVFSHFMAADQAEKNLAPRRFSTVAFVGTGMICHGLILLSARPFFSIFAPEDMELAAFASTRASAYFWGFPLAGFNILMISFWQSTQQTGKAVVISLLRSVLLLPILLWSVPMAFGRAAIWLCHSLAEALTACCAGRYEAEQAELKQSVESLSVIVEASEAQAVNVRSFLKIVKKYTEPTALTPQLLHEFVDKIVVHEADKSSGHRIQRIDVHYNFIGEVDFSPEFRR